MLHNISSLQNVGWFPLIFAAYNGHVEMLTLLLKKGANVNQTTNEGMPSLHWAASNSQEAAVAILLDNGADVNLANNDGRKPIDLATTEKIKDMLIAHTTKNQPDQAAVPKVMDEAQWFQAVREGKLALIQQGINDKFDVNCRDSGGRTALLGAAFYGHISLVEYLILQQADVNIPTVSANDTLLLIMSPQTSITSVLISLTSIAIPYVA